MCKVLKVPRSSYYRWLKDPEGARKRKYMELDEKIRDAYFAAKGRNGSPQLAKDLQVSGTPVSRTTVACHMREMGLRSKLSRRFKVTTDASHTVVPAIRMANRNRPFAGGMIFHSDRGIQYACKQTVNLLKSLKLEQSMSGKGNCWDNAVAESFFKTFKSELVYGTKLKTREQMRLYVFEYIESWYNHKRRFSALGNLTIDEFWNQYNLKKESIKNVA
jgi:transposase InsO family protein